MVASFCAFDQVPSPCTYARAAELKPELKYTNPSNAKKTHANTTTTNCSFLETGILPALVREFDSWDFSVFMRFACERYWTQSLKNGIVRRAAAFLATHSGR